MPEFPPFHKALIMMIGLQEFYVNDKKGDNGTKKVEGGVHFAIFPFEYRTRLKAKAERG